MIEQGSSICGIELVSQLADSALRMFCLVGFVACTLTAPNGNLPE
jgi:hypothetical protein